MTAPLVFVRRVSLVFHRLLNALSAPFLLALFFCAWRWATNRTTALRFTTTMSCKPSLHLLLCSLPDSFSAGFVDVSFTVIQQLSYLRFATLLDVAAGITLDANDVRGTSVRPTPGGGLARPVASASQARSR